MRIGIEPGSIRIDVSGIDDYPPHGTGIEVDGMPVLLPASSDASAALLLPDMTIYQWPK